MTPSKLSVKGKVVTGSHVIGLFGSLLFESAVTDPFKAPAAGEETCEKAMPTVSREIAQNSSTFFIGTGLVCPGLVY